MPYCASSVAAVMPVGPAPTMTTGGESSVISVNFTDGALGAQVDGAVVGGDRGLHDVAVAVDTWCCWPHA